MRVNLEEFVADSWNTECGRSNSASYCDRTTLAVQAPE